jgi:hypothetical protein
MPNNPPKGVPQIYPRLAYRDPTEAVAWLTRAFGLREREEARLSTEDGRISLTEGDGAGRRTRDDRHGWRTRSGEPRKPGRQNPDGDRVRERCRSALRTSKRGRSENRDRAARPALGRPPLRGTRCRGSPLVLRRAPSRRASGRMARSCFGIVPGSCAGRLGGGVSAAVPSRPGDSGLLLRPRSLRQQAPTPRHRVIGRESVRLPSARPDTPAQQPPAESRARD